MPRKIYETEPVVINYVNGISSQEHKTSKSSKGSERAKVRKEADFDLSSEKYLEVATTNKDKIKEIKRILSDFEVKPVDLDIEEIQSTDPYKVISDKAKKAYEKNGFNPVLVEDTSLELLGLNGMPGTYVKDFFEDMLFRKEIAEKWLNGRDRRAIARVMLGLYDGVEVFTWEGKVTGSIAETTLGTNGFGWDDIFIPDGQNDQNNENVKVKGSNKITKDRTFAEMSDEEKDQYSMRKKALEKFKNNPFIPHYSIFMLPEPYEQELERVQLDKIGNGLAKKFAYKLECLEGNRSNNNYTAPKYRPILKTENTYFTRFLTSSESKSIGLMLTDMDRKHIKMHKNGYPFLWEMGPERRFLALVQRADFFNRNQSNEVCNILDDLEKDIENFPKRFNRRSKTIDDALGFMGNDLFTKTISLKEIGYKKLSSQGKTSRSESATGGLFTKIGKYPRSIYAVGCLPWISGWRDVIVTSALSHMPVFVHRNNINAIDFRNQVDLIIESKRAIEELELGEVREARAMRNIGAALGCDPEKDLEKAKVLYKEAGVKLFRIYTINSDIRVVQTAEALRKEFGDEVEIFVGQLADENQFYRLIEPEIRADGFIFGHGGGRQCTSATNGMALTTLEEIYSAVINPDFNDVTIMVEGGIGTHIGALLILGVDGILRNAQFANCVIEQGDVYFEHNEGSFCQPYHGSASAAAMVIESYNSENTRSRLFPSGRAKNVEGESGYIYYSEKANTMTFYIDLFRHYAGRTLADLGVGSIAELRKFLKDNKQELLRVVSTDAAYTSTPWKK